MKRKGKSSFSIPIIAFAIIILISIGVFSILPNGSPIIKGSYTKYSNENYGVSFSYPSNWEKEVKQSKSKNTLVITVKEENPEKGIEATVQVMIAPKIMVTPSENYTLEALQTTIIKSIKDREGSKILNGAKKIEVEDQNGFKYSTEETPSVGRTGLSIKTWKREMILEKDNYLFIITGTTFQSTENYKPKLNKILNSFSFQP